MLAIKSNIISNQIDVTSTDCDCEVIARKIECDSNKSLIVISAYRPPNSSIEYSKALSNIITEICRKNKNSTIWLGGDLNLPDINWPSNTICSNQYRKEISETFLALEEDIGLIQIVNFPTRGQNMLDLFFTNRPSLINRCEAIPGISDHEIVFIDSNIAVSRQKPVKRKIYMWKKQTLRN